MYLKIYIEYADLLLVGKYISHIDIHRQLDLVSHYYVLEEKGTHVISLNIKRTYISCHHVSSQLTDSNGVICIAANTALFVCGG